jgi:hypothetical protein
MFLNPDAVDLLNVLLLVIGAVLTLRKAAGIGGDHRLKTFVLTAIFSLPIILFFLGCLTPPGGYSCTPLE